MERETGYEVEGTPGGQATAPSPGATRAGHPGNREQMAAALRAQIDDGTLKPGDVVSIV
jgi:DNA-binding GntR family transcriptional regulator